MVGKVLCFDLSSFRMKSDTDLRFDSRTRLTRLLLCQSSSLKLTFSFAFLAGEESGGVLAISATKLCLSVSTLTNASVTPPHKVPSTQ